MKHTQLKKKESTYAGILKFEVHSQTAIFANHYLKFNEYKKLPAADSCTGQCSWEQ